MADASQVAFKSVIHELDGCEITWGKFNHFARHSHDGLMLSLIDKGVQNLEYRGSRYKVGVGSVVAIAPEESHASAKAKSNAWVFRSVVVPRSVSERLTGNRTENYRCDVAIENPELSRSLNSFFNVLATGAGILSAEVVLAEVLDRVYLNHCTRKVLPKAVGKECQAVARSKEFLMANLHQNVSLQMLAEVANMDGFHLNRAFKLHCGLPPHAWHRQCRVRHAQRLLTQGVRGVDVATQCGFADQAHFSRVFKQSTGLSPKVYGQQQRGSGCFNSLADLCY